MAPRLGMQEKVTAIGDLSRNELVELWVKHFRCPPPFGVRQPMLVRAAAWHLQEKQLGGLSTNGKRLLKVAIKRVAPNGAVMSIKGRPGTASDGITREIDSERIDVDDARIPSPPRLPPSPGARLIREWNGRRYIVDVVEDGFVLDGKSYRSLTSIAFRITGVKWSGPRFFGL
jgi:hypothetical protein